MRSDAAPASKLLTHLGGFSVMMFLQYAIWGAWLPLFFRWLTEYRGFSPGEAGNVFAIAAVGALVAPLVAAQIADRWFDSEKLLGICHLAGAVLIWRLPSLSGQGSILIFSLLYSIIYAPTLSLTNSVAFHHLPDRDHDFAKVRVWGTVGWIAAGIGMGQWLLHHENRIDPGTSAAVAGALRDAALSDAFRLSAILGLVLGLFCFILPRTPPQPGRQKFAVVEASVEVWRSRRLLVLFAIAFPVSCVHQFYFVRTEGFLGSIGIESSFIARIFGVGGGPMTIGQIAEIVVLASMPLIATRFGRKALLAVGLAAYVLRFAVFAYLPHEAAVVPALALHGLCFGCFFFVAFMIVDEETSGDVRASAQSLFSLIIFGFGVIVGNFAAGWVGEWAQRPDASTDFRKLFALPMLVALASFVALLVFYPRKRNLPS
ncbi:MAG: MFS transporter [Planctomycetes bacterium]|nr:MFS transporter [Planctomycetota bacterium]